MEHARQLMAKLPWAMTAWALPGYEAESHIGFIAKFLSSSWLAEHNLDLMRICLNTATVESGNRTRSHVAPVYLGCKLQWIGDWSTERIREDRDLVEWRDIALQNWYCYLHIPTNLTDTHWVVFRIDIEGQSYSWGLLLIPTLMNAPC